MTLRRCLDNLEALGQHLLDIFVLVLEEAQCILNIAPLPLVLSARQTCSKLVGKLFGLFLLLVVSILSKRHREARVDLPSQCTLRGT